MTHLVIRVTLIAVISVSVFCLVVKSDDGIPRNKTVVLRDGRVLTSCTINRHTDSTDLRCNEGTFERVDNYEVRR